MKTHTQDQARQALHNPRLTGDQTRTPGERRQATDILFALWAATGDAHLQGLLDALHAQANGPIDAHKTCAAKHALTFLS